MGKLVLFMSFVCLGILLIFGAFMPDSPVVWLASTSKGFAELRIVMMIILTVLMVTTPPRNPFLRAIVGSAAVALFAWTVYGTYSNSIKLVDSMSLLLAAISTGLAALEQGFESDFDNQHQEYPELL